LSDGTKEEEGMSAIINMLVEKFPNAFFIYEGRRKPLKLKIHHDILEVMDIDPRRIERGDAHLHQQPGLSARECRGRGARRSQWL
jgi:hypothetical protein